MAKNYGLTKLVLNRLWIRLSEILGNQVIDDAAEKDNKNFIQNSFPSSINASSVSYARIDRYRDYENMDAESSYIHTALDIYSSDCCQFDSFTNATVWANSSDKKVSKELNKFLQETMEVEEVSEEECRNIAKYGSIKNLFILSEGKGIVKVKQLEDDIYIYRVEDENGILKGYVRQNPDSGNSGIMYNSNITDLDYKFYQIGHPRLKSRPYVKTVGSKYSNLYYDIPLEGMSMIDSARKPVRDYELLREAIMVYRVTHSIDRLEHKIDLSGKAPDEGLDYMQKFMNALKKKEYVDKETKRVSLIANLPSYMEDLFSPVWKDNLTNSQLLKITGDISSIEDLKLLQEEIEGSLKFPPGFLFRSDGASINFNRSLSQENIVLAKYIDKLQKAYKKYIFKACQVHLALRGENYKIGTFTINMSPISSSLDIQKTEILSTLITNAQNLLPFAENLGIDKNLWNKYVFRLTLGRIDFGEIVSSISDIQAQQSSNLILKIKEQILDNEPQFYNKFSKEEKEKIENFKKFLDTKDFNLFSEQLDSFLNFAVSNPYSSKLSNFNKLIDKEMYEFTDLLNTEKFDFKSEPDKSKIFTEDYYTPDKFEYINS